jgi:hypothetical protein
VRGCLLLSSCLHACLPGDGQREVAR